VCAFCSGRYSGREVVKKEWVPVLGEAVGFADRARPVEHGGQLLALWRDSQERTDDSDNHLRVRKEVCCCLYVTGLLQAVPESQIILKSDNAKKEVKLFHNRRSAAELCIPGTGIRLSAS
jgi:hypothetical protein